MLQQSTMFLCPSFTHTTITVIQIEIVPSGSGFWLMWRIHSQDSCCISFIHHFIFYLSISVTSHHSFTPRKLIFPDHYISTSNSDQSFISCITIFRLQRLYRNMSRITSINQRPASSDITENSTTLLRVKSLSVLNSVWLFAAFHH